MEAIPRHALRECCAEEGRPCRSKAPVINYNEGLGVRTVGGVREVKFYPYKNGGGGGGGGRQSLSHARGGTTRGTQRFGVHSQVLEVLSMLKWGCKRFPPFKKGAQNVYPVWRGVGVQKVLDVQFSHFVEPHPPPLPRN